MQNKTKREPKTESLTREHEDIDVKENHKNGWRKSKPGVIWEPIGVISKGRHSNSNSVLPMCQV